VTDVETVAGLVARFALRRRASTTVFAEGVRLARLGAVALEQVSPSEVKACVEDGTTLEVTVFASDGQLLGTCPCSSTDDSPCRHQVAVAHAVWVKGRRGVV
jgi:uncharacterized Zn finger protein